MGSNGMDAAEVVSWLRVLALEHREGSPEDKALSAAADALETEIVVEIDLGMGRVQVVQTHPLLSVETIGSLT